jgi:hypothetical protein
MSDRPVRLFPEGQPRPGWFGFNAGNTLSAGQLAGYALVNAQFGACTLVHWRAQIHGEFLSRNLSATWSQWRSL